MSPAQFIRSLGQPCKLAGIEPAHAEALTAGDDAPLEVAIDLVDALLAALEAQLPEPVAREPRSSRRHLDQVRSLAAEGKSDPAIAEALGLTVPAVRAMRRRYDIPSGVDSGGSSLRRGWEDQVRAQHAAGKTTAQIAEAMGWTIRTTQQRLYLLDLRAHRSAPAR